MEKFYYFRMPKTGSTFLADVLKERLGDSVHIEGHGYLYKDGEIHVRGLNASDQWRFCFVRHPFERFVSAYRHIMAPRGSSLNEADTNARNGIGQYADLKEFCLNLEEFTADEKNTAIHFYPQHRWITDSSGDLTMDYVGKYETMDDCWKVITDKLAIEYQPIFGRNEGTAKGGLRSLKKLLFDGLKQYDDVAPAVVEFYRKDFELFGYDPDLRSS